MEMRLIALLDVADWCEKGIVQIYPSSVNILYIEKVIENVRPGEREHFRRLGKQFGDMEKCNCRRSSSSVMSSIAYSIS